MDDEFVVHSPVGRFHPNRYGLYDVLGNVSEWCLDGYAEYDAEQRREGDGFVEVTETDTPYRIYRGGSFGSIIINCRTASRNRAPAEVRSGVVGCRLAGAVVSER